MTKFTKAITQGLQEATRISVIICGQSIPEHRLPKKRPQQFEAPIHSLFLLAGSAGANAAADGALSARDYYIVDPFGGAGIADARDGVYRCPLLAPGSNALDAARCKIDWVGGVFTPVTSRAGDAVAPSGALAAERVAAQQLLFFRMLRNLLTGWLAVEAQTEEILWSAVAAHPGLSAETRRQVWRVAGGARDGDDRTAPASSGDEARDGAMKFGFRKI